MWRNNLVLGLKDDGGRGGSWFVLRGIVIFLSLKSLVFFF